MRSCTIISEPNTIRITFYLKLFSIVQFMEDIHIPARNPPKWPYTSTELLEGVKMKMNIIIMRAVHQIWHFICGPTKSKPFQFIMMYPIMTPIMPKRAVDAPAFTPSGEHTKLKIFPLMPQTKQMISVRTNPNEYSILDKNMNVVIRLPKMCIKQTWRNMAEINRQTCPSNTDA